MWHLRSRRSWWQQSLEICQLRPLRHPPQTGVFYLAEFPLIAPALPFFISDWLIVTVCLSHNLNLWPVAQQSNRLLVFMQSYALHWQCLFLSLLEGQSAVCWSPFEGLVGGLLQGDWGGGGGLFISAVLCMGLWDDVLSELDDRY